MLGIVGGFWKIFGFVEMCVLGLLMVPSSWLNIMEMYILLLCKAVLTFYG